MWREFALFWPTAQECFTNTIPRKGILSQNMPRILLGPLQGPLPTTINRVAFTTVDLFE